MCVLFCGGTDEHLEDVSPAGCLGVSGLLRFLRYSKRFRVLRKV